ncbi:MAG: mechanosensitive ion channel domain-containing protein [Nitrosotalea sp.]
MKDSHNSEKGLLEPIRQDTLQKELTSLAIKTIIIVIGSWLTLYLFEIFVVPIIGLQRSHVQTVGSVVTITIALVTIIATRRILHKFSSKIHPQFSASISFFIIIFIALIASVSILYQWDVNPQEILVGGGVAAIVVGIGVSTIVGNIFSGGLMLTTFPAKIGDSIFIVNDNVRGKIEEITMMYTKVLTEQGTEYVVPNNAIIQGNIRITKEASLGKQLPFTEGDRIELTDSSGKYAGTVIKITPRFSTILSDDKKKETIFANNTILSGQFIITKDRTK